MRHAMLLFAMVFAVSGCDNSQPEPTADTATPAEPAENVLALEIVGMSFVGPDEIGSGWTTIRITNNSGMTHHGLVYRLPDGITAAMMDEQVMKPFQESLTANIAGDVEKAAEIMQNIPPWIGDIIYMGGPGMISDGVVGETTMYLEPGNYIVECYVKTNGVQHNYNPEPRRVRHGFAVDCNCRAGRHAGARSDGHHGDFELRLRNHRR